MIARYFHRYDLTGEVTMKKIFIIFLFLAVAASGYLYYDWHAKTKNKSEADKITLYSWEDEKGLTHFSDKMPPGGARNIQKTNGYKYAAPPLVLTIKWTVENLYHRTKTGVNGLFKSKSKKNGKGSVAERFESTLNKKKNVTTTRDDTAVKKKRKRKQ